MASANEYNVFSSGGVGDALIVGLKIQSRFPNVKVTWRHFERHECHADPISDIQQQFATSSEVLIMGDTEASAKEMCHNMNGIYIDTVIKGFMNPYLKAPLKKNAFNLKLGSFKDHVVIQTHAGRMDDNTRREVSSGVINVIRHQFLDKKIVLIGPEQVDLDFPTCINLTGKTESVIDAMQVINDCSLFIGQDGVLAYYAMMLKKPTIVAYHLPNLMDHYWDEAWRRHAVPIVGAGNSLFCLPMNDNRIVSLLGQAK